MTHEEKLSPRAIWGSQLKWLSKQTQDLASKQYDCVPRKGESVQSICMQEPSESLEAGVNLVKMDLNPERKITLL